MLKDKKQRQQATDPRQSFIVQAPAGSGKTEILTQRFLRLLSLVHAPEQIVALTFTRKAASEMRERILMALKKAATGVEAQSPHQQMTLGFAEAALKRDREQNWQLLEQPHRLRIMTIDALCQTLTQAIPLIEKQLPYADITDQPQPCYQQAARDCIAYALAHQALHPAIQTLLEHLDNRQDRLLELFSNLLATRDQWLETLYQARELNKEVYEQALNAIEQHELERLTSSIPSHLQDELCDLCRQLASVENDPHSPRYGLSNWQTFSQLNRELAAAMSSALLTATHQLRKGFDYHVGLRKEHCEKTLFAELKARSKQLLEDLGAYSDFLEALNRVSQLPSPHYDPDQWQVLQALLTLLPLLVAHLHWVFSEANLTDFAAIAQQALLALGDDEQPTDLALYLDNTIHHLLVDEFQDTSIQQSSLLQKLVQGWQAGDGKTLFVVGDPMQSIYRFRQAEVGLFLKARKQGIGQVQLKPLELCCNFRSTATIIDWVNTHFKAIFPQSDDVESGAISFHPSVHVHESNENSLIQAWQFNNRHQEARHLVNLVKAQLDKYPDDQLAILVRSRSHLNEIVSLLRQEQVPFQGVDIEKLSSLIHLRDIWSLTQALLFPADRLAWLALLRSPWCGLSLADLQILANFDKKKSLYLALKKADQLPGVSEEGITRIRYFIHIMSQALACRQQQSLVDWVAQTADQLLGDHILNDSQRDDLEQFWLLLDKHSQDGQLADVGRFKEAMNQLYSQRVTPSRLQIMTIHKSKGLEFDTVILPGLGNKPPNRDQPLMRWLRLPSAQQDDLLLISPIRAAHKTQCLVYDYLGKLEAEKESYELQRLLYVAATRAKKRLYLLDSQDKENKKSTFRTLLQQQPFIQEENESTEDAYPPQLPALFRLPIDYYRELPPPIWSETNEMILSECRSNARQIGIITHELMQWICNHHPQTIQDLPWSMVHNQFRLAGLDQTQLQDAMTNLQQQITRLFDDPIGQWLCQAHSQEKNEYELLVSQDNRANTRIIDRTFCYQGLRWIIDFKTGHEDNQSQLEHQKQVNGYAKLMADLCDKPIHCGLYYLATGHWLSWAYNTTFENALI